MKYQTTLYFRVHAAAVRVARVFAASSLMVAAFGCAEPELDEVDDLAEAQIDGDDHGEFRGVAEDGFVNPLSGKPYTTEANDGDGYYSALDWTERNPGVGLYHCGEDWNGEGGGNSDLGDPVYATANGVVRNSGHYGAGWGNIIMVEHYIPTAAHHGYVYITSVYAHLESRLVSVGDVVTRGQKIGTVGTADGAYPAHLHFEMRWDEDLGPTANAGYNCPNEQSGTFDPTDFIRNHPPGWSN